jgi:hypothetical protein
MEKRDLYILGAVGVVVAGLFALVVVEGAAYLGLSRQFRAQQVQLTQIQVKLDELESQSILRPLARLPSFQSIPGQNAQVRRTVPFAGLQPPWMSSSPSSQSAAAPDSIEGQIVAQGKRWERTIGNIVPGAYVEDILTGRLGQPEGRGTVGKVVSVDTSDIGHESAQVDFGRGYTTTIYFTELSPVVVTAK